MTEHFRNTENYWDSRFAADWQACGGQEQTRFFAELALRSLPAWIARDIGFNRLSILDWGCAEGDATETLGRALQTSVTGVDISERAIESARARFRDRRFLRASAAEIEPHDVLFTSNTLEHFDNPLEILRTLLARIRKYAIVLVPFREARRHDEHLFTFDLNSFPYRIGDFYLLSYVIVDAASLTDTRWLGQQILVVYGNERTVPPEQQRLATLASGPLDQLEAAQRELERRNSEVSRLDAARHDLERRLAEASAREVERREAERRGAARIAEARAALAEIHHGIRRVRAQRIHKWVTLARSLRRHPLETLATLPGWLRSAFRPEGLRLAEVLSANDPFCSLETRARTALAQIDGDVPEPGATAFRASDSRLRTWRSGLSCALRVRKALSGGRGSPLVALQVDGFDKGGLEEVVLTLARHLKRAGEVQVVVLVAGTEVGYLGSLAREEGIPVLPLGRDRLLLRLVLGLLPIRLVNLHYSTFGAEVYSRARIPVVYTIHNTYVWATPAFVRERAAAYRRAAAFIAVSDPVRDFFASRFQVDPSLVTTIPNGLDLEYAAEAEPVSRASLGLASDDVVFVNVASFNWLKFHVLMVAALERLVSRFPKTKLLLVGNVHEPDCLAYVRKAVAERGLGDHVRILEYQPKRRIIGLLEASDCFLLPSLIEGCSIAIMEAMYAGLPLILSDVGSARAMIRDGDIGIVIRSPYDDIRQLTPETVSGRYMGDAHLDNMDDLVAAMESICLDRDGWRRRARPGRERILGMYSSAHMSREYLSCYQRVMEQAGAQ